MNSPATIRRRISLLARPLKRTNRRGTCLWCGNRLRAKYEHVPHLRGQRGYAADNAFCSLRCGFEFGVAAASRGGFRLREITRRLDE